MSDTQPPVDDEVVSAVLDGVATPEERALVEGSPQARARLDQLRRAATEVGRAVDPLPPSLADDLVARAVAAGAADTAVAAAGPGPSAPAAGDELAARRRGRAAHAARLAAAVVGVAAAALLLVGVVSVVGRGSSSDESASQGATAAAPDADGADAAGGSGAAADAPLQSDAGASVPDLGTGGDAEVLLARLATLVGDEQVYEHATPMDRSSAEASGERADPTAACTAPSPPAAAVDGWVVVATGSLPGGAVVVVTDGPPISGERALALDAATCRVLAERVL